MIKSIFKLFLLLASISMPIASYATPHLILYFDVNETVITRDTNISKGSVFPSFYSLLEHLDSKDISYSIILRSFSQKIVDVKNEINSKHKKMFDQFGRFRKGKLLLENETIENPFLIYNHLRRSEHIAIHDDYKYWNSHRRSSTYGKPFYIDTADRDTLPIFFDDNITENEIKNIIAPIDVATGKQVPIKDLILSGQAVHVDTLKALSDLNYYINHVEYAWSHWGLD